MASNRPAGLDQEQGTQLKKGLNFWQRQLPGLCRLLGVRLVLGGLAGAVAVDHQVGVRLVDRAASAVVEETDHGSAKSSDQVDQNTLAEEVRKACPGTLDQEGSHLAVDHIRGCTEDNSFGTEAAVDAAGAVESSGAGMEADCAEDPAVTVGQVEMRSVRRRVRKYVCRTKHSKHWCNSDLLVRRKATENIHTVLRFRNRSVIYIRYVSS
jgi:hypothetical protein